MIRVRFAPSPTGYLHIGGARTLLFNWLFARQSGGVFVLRIEDTDQSRHVEDSVAKILSDMRWLGMDWDEGPEVGGDCGPYYQSQRLELYEGYLQQLLESGDAYYALETTEELAAQREAARTAKAFFRYCRPEPVPTIDEGLAARAAGQAVTVRFKMPEADVVVHDRVLGEVRLPREELEDFVIQKADGWPTYHFACVVDDELMGITHVLRGQEHLANTPKHVAMQKALGFRTPDYAHLSIIFNPDGSKMSKRDKEKALTRGLPPPEIDMHDFRVAGYLPEALLNFISLLGWSPGDDLEQISLEETIRRFSLDRIGSTNARFDRDKLLAFNTDWASRLPEARLLELTKDFARASESPLRQADDEQLSRLLKLCSGFRTFRDVERKCGFLFVEDEQLEFSEKAVAKVLSRKDGAGFVMLEVFLERAAVISDWSPAELEKAVNALCERFNAKLGDIAQPIRVAVTGDTVSPPIFDTLALLGKDRCLARIQRALALRSHESSV